MKRTVTCLSIIGLGCIGTTFAINYFIYDQVNHYSISHPDRIKIEKISWGWGGVLLSSVKTNNPHFNQQFQAKTVFLSHHWRKPFNLQVQISDVEGPQLKMVNANATLSYSDSIASSPDLILNDVSIKLQRKGSHGIHEVEVKVPQIQSSFQYHIKTSDLTLTADVPSFANDLLTTVSLNANGKLQLRPKTNGKIHLHIKGLTDIISFLIDNNIIKKKKANLFMLGAQFLGGQNNESDLPLSFDQGSVYLGPFPIYERK